MSTSWHVENVPHNYCLLTHADLERPLHRLFGTQPVPSTMVALSGAEVISGLMGERPDTIAILAIVLLNGLFGFFQEERAEHALAALKKLSAPLAKVFRDGVLHSLPARELVPGDLLELEAGDNVPADARLSQAFGLRVQEAALTGESVPVMTVQEIVVGGERFQVTGVGYAPKGQFLKVPTASSASDEQRQPDEARTNPDLLRTLTIGLWCNNAKVNPQGWWA